MSKKILFLFLVLIGLSTKDLRAKEINVYDDFLWRFRSYAPELFLQPHGDFNYFNPIHTNLCTAQSIPFWEGFNTDSTTLSCWTTIDVNNNPTPVGGRIFRPQSYGPYEGDQSMYFSGNSDNDSWLISPILELDSTKVYKLRYHYKTRSFHTNDFEVLASNQGLVLSNFTRTLVPKSSYLNDEWLEQVAFISGLGGDTHIAWRVHSPTRAVVFIDQVIVEEIPCMEPQNLDVREIQRQQVTLSWSDDLNQSWEYYVQDRGNGVPTGAGIAITTTELVVSSDYNQNALQSNTPYEYYVRAVCSNGNLGDWIGPFTFVTACDVLPPPFQEGFNTTSSTLNCWTIVDQNADKIADGNVWQAQQGSTFEGDGAMYFFGAMSADSHDDWLISPTVSMTGGIYAITYHYKTIGYAGFDNDFEVLLSTTGTATSNFTTVLEASTKRNVEYYTKKTYYVQGITADVNIAWHVMATGEAHVYIDMVSIEEVGCSAPADELLISDLQRDRVKFTWRDTLNTNWEYYVQPLGSSGLPVGSGTLSSTNSVTVTQTTGIGGGNLQPNSWYEFFVRASCSPTVQSVWVGPIAFKTPCDFMALPFWEGFNTNSTTADCWFIIDRNNDGTTAPIRNKWTSNSWQRHEGDQSIYFEGTPTTTAHDDWLVSPTFNLDATKFYRLRFHSKTNTFLKVDFDVLLSNNGIATEDFTQKLLQYNEYNNEVWTEAVTFISGIGGATTLAWHIKTQKEGCLLYLDNVFLEEVSGCPEPLSLNAEKLEKDQANVLWSDAYGQNWEYVVQTSGGGIPSGSGVFTNKKENTVTADFSGKQLQPNREYEFYVRTVCGSNAFSSWSGPFLFRTACKIYDTPFWEGFNRNSINLNCWTLIAADGGMSNPTFQNDIPPFGFDQWLLFDRMRYEGTHVMAFSKTNTYSTSDDWLISPTFHFETNKTYRLKYHFYAASDNAQGEFDVLASNSGISPANFTKILLQAQNKNRAFEQKTIFINDLDGEVNLAWHISGSGAKEVYIDHVFVEEVDNCPEPLNLELRDIKKDQLTLIWTDDHGATNWEYIIDEIGNGIPVGSGIQTSNKQNLVTEDKHGNPLQPNTDYELYVRTICDQGGYSIWQGPIRFHTLCGTYQTPYWEGFNTDSKTARCWTLIDKSRSEIPIQSTLTNRYPNGQAVYEGDRAVQVSLIAADRTHDDWLISPAVELDGGMYVLKYHYKTTASPTTDHEFEVLLSNQGKDVSQFNTVLRASQVYRLGNYTEEVILINGIIGPVNIAWHIKSKNTISSVLYLDNVWLKKVENCPEPYAVKATQITPNSMEIHWQQQGGITSWEVLVVNYGEDQTSSSIVFQQTVNGTATTITGLDAGQVYTVFVRAKCLDSATFSDWSTPYHEGTSLGGNGDCIGARTIPVNTGLSCLQSISVNLKEASAAAIATALCPYGSELVDDLWFEFTALANIHLLGVNNLKSLSNNTGFPTVYAALYDSDCSAIDYRVMDCFRFNPNESEAALIGLIPGQKYYLRIGTRSEITHDYIFNLCLTTSDLRPIEVSPSGEIYSVEELIQEVFIQSDCDLVSNIRYQNGDGSAPTQQYNTLGYFNRGNADFPFEQGIVLSTNEVQYVARPYMGYHGFRGNNDHRWIGDKDINDAIHDAGGGPSLDKRVTQIEFDFIPIKDSIKFEYVFASVSYHKNCGEVCNAGALFAAWLVDSTTGEGRNLAKVPGTSYPISINTIRDADKSGAHCESIHPEWYGKHFDQFDQLIEAPIDFVGLTQPMESEMVAVTVGRKYHIKLAIMDFCPTIGHSSAVFFNANSFDLGNLDLGEDLLIENNNALCAAECVVIESQLSLEGAEIQWYKDEVAVVGAHGSNLEICEAGTYKVQARYHTIQCELTGAITVEMYPPISEILKAPEPLYICRQSLLPAIIDLTTVEQQLLVGVDGSENYQFSYYRTRSDADQEVNSIEDPNNYELQTKVADTVLFIKALNRVTGCSGIVEYVIKPVKGAMDTQREDVHICSSYILPDLAWNQSYYSEAGANGKAYQSGDVFEEPGSYTVFVFQDNGDGCYEEISYKIIITAPIEVAVFKDQTLECRWYTLEPLPPHNKYFTEAHGGGEELAVNTVIAEDQTIYVYASSQDGVCIDQSSFTIKYAECPIPKGISPNGDGFNDAFDLSDHGVSSIKIFNRYGTQVYSFAGNYTNQWAGQDQKGRALPDGTYYYVLTAHNKTRTGWVQINK